MYMEWGLGEWLWKLQQGKNLCCRVEQSAIHYLRSIFCPKPQKPQKPHFLGKNVLLYDSQKKMFLWTTSQLKAQISSEILFWLAQKSQNVFCTESRLICTEILVLAVLGSHRCRLSTTSGILPSSQFAPWKLNMPIFPLKEKRNRLSYLEAGLRFWFQLWRHIAWPKALVSPCSSSSQGWAVEAPGPWAAEAEDRESVACQGEHENSWRQYLLKLRLLGLLKPAPGLLCRAFLPTVRLTDFSSGMLCTWVLSSILTF